MTKFRDIEKGGSAKSSTIFLKNRIADSQTDAAAMIQAALNTPGITTVVLPKGVIAIGTTITIPDGKTLMGAGPGLTKVVAMSDFASSAGVPFPGVMVFASGASNVTVKDLSLDGAKVGLGAAGDIVSKVSGIVMFNTTDFLVENVHVQNITGYAQWAVGSWNYQNPELSVFSSGKYVDCTTANANVHFEQTTAAGVHVLRSSSTDGDGDIPTEAYLHPLVGSSNIVFEDSYVRGTGDGVGALVVSVGVAMGDVTFINPDIVTKNNGMTIAGSENAPIASVEVHGGSIVSTGNLGVLSVWTTNSSYADTFISGVKMGIMNYNGTIDGLNSVASAATDLPGAASFALAHYGVGTAKWVGALKSDSATGAEYNYGGVVEWFFEGAYRDAFGTPIPAPELSVTFESELIDTYGLLRLEHEVGGDQTIDYLQTASTGVFEQSVPPIGYVADQHQVSEQIVLMNFTVSDAGYFWG